METRRQQILEAMGVDVWRLAQHQPADSLRAVAPTDTAVAHLDAGTRHHAVVSTVCRYCAQTEPVLNDTKGVLFLLLHPLNPPNKVELLARIQAAVRQHIGLECAVSHAYCCQKAYEASDALTHKNALLHRIKDTPAKAALMACDETMVEALNQVSSSTHLVQMDLAGLLVSTAKKAVLWQQLKAFKELV